jgi:hypothetical protein
MRKATLVGMFAAAVLATFACAAQGAPVSYRGLDCDALGSASALVWSPKSNLAELHCSEIGSSGQDGISVALPASTGAWQCLFGPTPAGMVSPDQLSMSLFDSSDPADLPMAVATQSMLAGRVQWSLDCPDATEYIVRIYSDNTLVFSGVSLSPPVVELPTGVSVCEPGSTTSASTGEASISNTRQRILDLETKLIAIGLLLYNGTDFQGNRINVVAVGAGASAAGIKMKEVRRAELRASCATPGSGGGGGGGFSVSNHSRRFGIGIDTPAPPLGMSVSDGSVLSSPSPGLTRVMLGGGTANWRATFSDLSRPASLLHCWGMDFAPIPASSLTGGAQLECRVPSSWTSGPDTTRIAVLDDGGGLGTTLHVMNGDGVHIKLFSVLAWSGSSPFPLAGGASPATLVVPVNNPPTAFHVVEAGGDLLVRCPMPAGSVFFSNGSVHPCDSLEVRVSGSGDDDCDGLLPCTLAGHAVDHCDVLFVVMTHMHQVATHNGVSVSATGHATISGGGGGAGGLIGEMSVRDMSVLGCDGAVMSGAGGALRVELKDKFQDGDIPTQQQFTAVIDSRFGSGPPPGDGGSDEVSSLEALYSHGTGGGMIARYKVHCVHRGEGRLFVQLSDGTICDPSDCDDDGDGTMDFRQLMGGTTSIMGHAHSVSYRRDSPWTECFDVEFRAPMTVTVHGEDHDILGLRVWRNRGGEHIGTPAPPVGALRLNGLPPGVPVTGTLGVCGLDFDRIDVHTAGSGIEAHGLGSTIDGFPVVETWCALADSGGTDCDDDDPISPGLTLRVRGRQQAVVIDKKFPLASPAGPVHRGIAFTATLDPAMDASGEGSFEMVMGGTSGGVMNDHLAVWLSKKGYDHYMSKATMANAQSNPLYVECFSGGLPTTSFLQTDSIAISRAPGAVVCVGDYGGSGRLAIVLSGFAPGTTVRPPGGGPDQDCDRVVISPSGAYEPATFDGSCAISLWGLPPGIPVTGTRLAAIPFEDPALAVGPGAPVHVFALSRPWPNPARGALRANFSLPAAAQVRARVFDLGGRMVATLADARFAAGQHTLAWDGRLAGGAPAPAGLYFLRVTRDGRDARTARFTQLR